jgi:hypothetical protein
LVSLWLSLAIVLGVAAVVPESASASSVTVISMGEVWEAGFFATYTITWILPDCVQAFLYLDGTLVNSSDTVCGNAGDLLELEYLYTPAMRGFYTLNVLSHTRGNISTRSWRLPSLEISATVTPDSAVAGTSVWVSVKYELTQGGVDSYARQGRLTVREGGRSMVQDVWVDLYNPLIDLMFGLGPRDERRAFFTGMPLALSAPGEKTVDVSYTDTLQFYNARLTFTVGPSGEVEDLRARVEALEGELKGGRQLLASPALDAIGGPVAIVALVLSVAAIVLAVALGRRRVPVPPPPPTAPPVAEPSIPQGPEVQRWEDRPPP